MQTRLSGTKEGLFMNYQIGDTVFNDWEIVRYIGRGASGVVYEIQKKEQGILHTSALKVL